MIPRKLFAVLLFALPILTVIFVVVMGGFLLLSASADNAGASVIRWIGISLLLLIIADIGLLTGALAVEHYLRHDPPSDSDA